MTMIKNTIESQLPRYIVREYPLFVEFLKAYYEWMEQEGQPYYGITKHLDWMNFQSSMDDYVSFLRQEYLFNLPANVAGGLELFLKNSKQFHMAVGTEQSFKFIFKILFGDDAGDVELYFPRKDILRVSESTWTGAQQMICVTDSGNSNEFLYRVIKQTREIYPGVFRYATAIVQRVSNRYAGKYKLTELYLTDIQGEFLEGWPVTVQDKSEWILPTANAFTIETSGSLYYLDDKVSLSGSHTFTRTLTATERLKIDSRVSGVFEEVEIVLTKNGQPFTDFTYDGRNIVSDEIEIGDVFTVTFPSYDGYIVISELSSTGGITQLNIIDTPIGFETSAPINIISTGSGFTGTLWPKLSKDIAGYYIDDTGHLNSTKVIQDSNYYQDFSYVIKSSLDIDKYKDIVLKLLHPAGMKMFGQVNIIQLVKLFIRDAYDIISIPNQSVFSDISSVKLYTSYRFIDDHKLDFEQREYRVGHFINVRVGDIIENNGYKPLNIQCTYIDIDSPYESTLDVSNELDIFANVQLPYNLRNLS